MIAHTIADPSATLRAGLAGTEGVGVVHLRLTLHSVQGFGSGQALAEALQYRPRELT